MEHRQPHDRAVTVIALCYNHRSFLVECLDSIQAQTFQDFQLIITDDCSKDDSASLIEGWIAAHRPDALFIRHEQNQGLCKTLNEALRAARGEFISMIATDDVWEPDKITRQLAHMRSQPQSVAVVYSDATRIDEAGNRVPTDFIEAHAPGSSRPSGKIFSELANRNFIPAMATLIRTDALVAVGGYDEQLTYEDYDMWLRLSAAYSFAYLDAVVARYRILPTSLVRTVFVQPTARHYYTTFLICNKWLPLDVLTQEQRAVWLRRLWDSAYGLYTLDDPRAAGALWRAATLTRKFRPLLLAILSAVGLSRRRVKRMLKLTGP